MLDNALKQVKFDNFFKLTGNLSGRIAAIGVFNRRAEPLWEVSYAEGDSIERLRAVARQHPLKQRGHVNGLETRQLAPDHRVFLVPLLDADNRPVATLIGLSADRVAVHSLQSPPIGDALTALADCLEAEIHLLQMLSKKEKELESMADELVERYEELNLVYEAERDNPEATQGQEALRNLVYSCTDFLDVGMSALLLPGKGVAVYHFNPSGGLVNTSKLVSSIKQDIATWMIANGAPLVVNKALDAINYEIVYASPEKLLAYPVVNGDSKIIGLLAIANSSSRPDFTNSDRNLLEVLAKKVSNIVQANFDPLTGLENLRSFEWNVHEALTEARERGQTHAILEIDIDHFGVVNDIWGRQAGDQLLNETAQLIKKAVRARDIVGRLSGDTFAVLLESCPIESATQLAQNVCEQVSGMAFEWQGHTHDVSISVGIAPITAESPSVNDLFSSVEVALKSAKERCNNSIEVFEVGDDDLARRRAEIQWVSQIQTALRDDRFQLYAQPIRSLQAGNPEFHYEILLRMQGEEDRVIAPGEFLPAAERYHLMPGIDRWVIRNTFERLLTFSRINSRCRCPVAINLSGQSLSDASFLQFVLDQLEGLGGYRRDICFEVTESAAIANIQEAKTFISQVKQIGCEFSLDDFGTGLSSFSYLQNLDVDYLKIDGSFVKNIEKDDVSRSMVSAINQVGQTMGLKTIAEYVEDDTIANILTQLEVDFGQGYGLGRPKPIEEMFAEVAAAYRVAS